MSFVTCVACCAKGPLKRASGEPSRMSHKRNPEIGHLIVATDARFGFLRHTQHLGSHIHNILPTTYTSPWQGLSLFFARLLLIFFLDNLLRGLLLLLLVFALCASRLCHRLLKNLENLLIGDLLIDLILSQIESWWSTQTDQSIFSDSCCLLAHCYRFTLYFYNLPIVVRNLATGAASLSATTSYCRRTF